jgi:hypothetical protein
MNRSLKRQLERDFRRGITRTDRVVPLPSLIDEFTVFDIPQRIFDQLSNGAIDAVESVPVFRDNTGVLTEVVPALTGWIFTWQKINDDLALNLNLGDLALVCTALEKNTLITQQNIVDAKLALDACRQTFRICDRKEVMSIAKTAQLQIMLDVA